MNAPFGAAPRAGPAAAQAPEPPSPPAPLPPREPAPEPAPEAPPEPAAEPAEAVRRAADEAAEGLRERAELAEEIREGDWSGLLDQVRELWGDLLDFLPLFAVALAVLVVFAWLARLAGRLDRPYRRLSPNPFVRDLLRQVARALVFLVGLLAALEIVGATALATAVLGTAGVLGLALGFAFRDVAENYVAGVLLSLRQPFAPNDHVTIEGHEGKVIRLTSRATVLMTLDGNHLRIPNASVFKGVILNYTRNPRRRLSFTLGIGPDEDLDAALAIGIAALAETAGVLEDPASWAEVLDVGESTVPVQFHAWFDQRHANYFHIRSEAIQRVKTALERSGVELPAPTYRLQMGEGAAAGAEEAEPRKPSGPRPTPAAPSEIGPQPGPADAIDSQIAAERADTPESSDLLSPDAPRE